MTRPQLDRLHEAIEAVTEDLRVGLYPWFLFARRGAGAKLRLVDYAMRRRWMERPMSPPFEDNLAVVYGFTSSYWADLDAEEARPTGIGGVLRALHADATRTHASRPLAPVVALDTARSVGRPR